MGAYAVPSKQPFVAMKPLQTKRKRTPYQEELDNLFELISDAEMEIDEKTNDIRYIRDGKIAAAFKDDDVANDEILITPGELPSKRQNFESVNEFRGRKEFFNNSCVDTWKHSTLEQLSSIGAEMNKRIQQIFDEKSLTKWLPSGRYQ